MPKTRGQTAKEEQSKRGQKKVEEKSEEEVGVGEKRNVGQLTETIIGEENKVEKADDAKSEKDDEPAPKKAKTGEQDISKERTYTRQTGETRCPLRVGIFSEVASCHRHYRTRPHIFLLSPKSAARGGTLPGRC